ncbi:MAG: hypothetical protein V3V99_01585 [candidate division Zixibacteria bacterium]
MRLRSLIIIFGLLLALTPGSDAAAESVELIDNGRSLTSSFRHYMFINHDEHHSRFVTSRVGGILESTPYKGARIGWLISDNRLNLRDNGLNKTNINITHHDKSGSVYIDMPLFSVLELRTRATVSRSISRTQFIFGTKLSYTPVEALLLTVDIGKNSKSLFLDSSYDTELISIPFSVDWYHYGLSVRIKLHENLTLFSVVNDIDLMEDIIPNDEPYSSNISGSGNYRYFGIMFEKTNRGYVKFSVSQVNGGGKINLHYDNVRFGQLSKIIGNLSEWQCDVSYNPVLRNWKLSFERMHFAGDLSGNVQSWPFGDQLTDLLGLRRNFTAQADIVLWKLTVDNDFKIGRNGFFRPALNLFRAYPDMRFSHWQPAFLVFGVADLQKYVSNLKRVDFGRLFISAGKKWNRFVLSCDISQFFPIKITKFESDDNGTSSAPTEPAEASNGSKKNPLKLNSGRNIQVRLQYLF